MSIKLIPLMCAFCFAETKIFVTGIGDYYAQADSATIIVSITSESENFQNCMKILEKNIEKFEKATLQLNLKRENLQYELTELREEGGYETRKKTFIAQKDVYLGISDVNTLPNVLSNINSPSEYKPVLIIPQNRFPQKFDSLTNVLAINDAMNKSRQISKATNLQNCKIKSISSLLPNANDPYFTDIPIEKQRKETRISNIQIYTSSLGQSESKADLKKIPYNTNLNLLYICD